MLRQKLLVAFGARGKKMSGWKVLVAFGTGRQGIPGCKFLAALREWEEKGCFDGNYLFTQNCLLYLEHRGKKIPRWKALTGIRMLYANYLLYLEHGGKRCLDVNFFFHLEHRSIQMPRQKLLVAFGARRKNTWMKISCCIWNSEKKDAWMEIICCI